MRPDGYRTGNIEGSMFNSSQIFYMFHFDWFGRINFKSCDMFLIGSTSKWIKINEMDQKFWMPSGSFSITFSRIQEKHFTWPILTYMLSTLSFMIGWEKSNQRLLIFMLMHALSTTKCTLSMQQSYRVLDKLLWIITF